MLDVLRRLFGGREPAEAPPTRDIRALTASMMQPAIHVVLADSPSRSHFGGEPNLPAGMSWPEKNGRRLAFLARLSLTEMREAHVVPWLPSSGALLFFYDVDEQAWGFDPSDRGSFAVLHVPDLPAPAAQFSQGSGESVRYRSAAFRCIEVRASWERGNYSTKELSMAEWEELAAIQDAEFQGRPHHQVAGFPDPIQADAMELECQLASNDVFVGEPGGYKNARAKALKAGAAQWRLLLQVDTDDDLGVMWGDCGRLYYFVEEPKAATGDFSNAWLILQCF